MRVYVDFVDISEAARRPANLLSTHLDIKYEKLIYISKVAKLSIKTKKLHNDLGHGCYILHNLMPSSAPGES